MECKPPSPAKASYFALNPEKGGLLVEEVKSYH